MQRPAAHDVEQLVAAADAEHRHAARERVVQDRRVGAVRVEPRVARAADLLSVQRRVQVVVAAGHTSACAVASWRAASSVRATRRTRTSAPASQRS